MSLFNRILYAVKDTDPRKSREFVKVCALAKACDASLELFHAISAPLYLPERAGEMSLGAIKRDTLDLHLMRLEKIAARARRRGVAVSCTAVWDHPPHEAIVRRATEWHADLIVSRCHPDGGLRGLMRYTDWELIRTSKIPVLLLRDARPYRRPVILAAVDPVHAHAKPHDLDENILVGARSLAAILRGRMHVVHANHPPLLGLAAETPFTEEDLRSHGRREFEKLMTRGDLPARRGHLVEGDPVAVIPRVAGKLHARIAVMGAVSRSGLKRLFIGNTAERVLGKLACDVLVVKPGDFRQRVPAERRDTIVLASAPSSAFAG
jgi:universal stress protein E